MQANCKSEHLMGYVNLERPELSEVRDSDDPSAAFVEYLARLPRPRFRFEYERKAEILAFLQEHYESWRHFRTSSADSLAEQSVEEAKGARALSGVAELGRAWWATGDPAYGNAFERFYTVPTGEMFNWGSFNAAQGALELDAYFLLLDCPGFTTEGRIAFLDHLHAITDDAWDEHTSKWRQIHLGPEGHNWYLHGTQVLPFTGLLFPEFSRSAFFARTGAGIFEEHLRGHYKADGGARETSVGYQSGSMMGLWDFYLVAHRNGYPLSDGFAERLLRATHFLLKLMSPSGGLPSFGDGGHSPGGLTSLASVAAALTGDRECKWYAERCRKHLPGNETQTPGQIPSGAFWAVGMAGAATYAQTRERDPNLVSVLFGPTGYAALRSSDRPEASYLAVAAADRGPIVTSHGHNEVFSLDIHAQGTRFVGEMGCAPYGDSPGRQYDQKTEAHSCLTIDGKEQAPIVNEWRWQGHAIPAVRRWLTTPTHDFFHGVHEGYCQYPGHQMLHARKILFIKSSPQYWLVFDWLDSEVENNVTAYFHGCVPGRLDGRTILLSEDGGSALAIYPPKGDEVTAETVTNDGLTAFMKEKNLDPANYPCFAYRKRTKTDCLTWAIVPLAPEKQQPDVERIPVTLNGQPADPYQASAIQLKFPDCTDQVCISHTEFDADLELGQTSTWGNISFTRRAGDGTEMLAFDHTVADGICGR
ncbi:MAG: heparinase II/III family protein [Planctomycetota bacterium]|nr:heparinase II/III family protein [Planctomycetota bacterium]